MQGTSPGDEDTYILGKLLHNGIAIEDTFVQHETLPKNKAHAIVYIHLMRIQKHSICFQIPFLWESVFNRSQRIRCKLLLNSGTI